METTYLKKIAHILRFSQKKSVFPLVFLLFIAALLESLSIGLIVPFLSFIVDPTLLENQFFFLKIVNYQNYSLNFLYVLAIIILISVFVFKSIFLVFTSWYQFTYTASLIENLSYDLFSIYMNQSYMFHKNHHSSKLTRNVTAEVAAFQSILFSIFTLLIDSLVVLGVIILLLYFEHLATLTIIFPIFIFAYLFYLYFKKKLSNWGGIRMFNDYSRLQFLMQGFEGIKDIKIFGVQKYVLSQFSRSNKIVAIMNRNTQFLINQSRVIMELLAVFLFLTLLLVFLFRGISFTSSIPIIGLFTVAAFRVLPSVNRIIVSLQTLKFFDTVVHTIYNEIRLPYEDREFEDIDIPFNKQISFKDVAFEYSNPIKKIFQSLNINIEKNQSIGIYGSSGHGKSTMIDLLLGLIEPKHGKILVDEINIQRNLYNWHKNIGYVPQQITLNDDSIKRNIAIGYDEKDINMEKMDEVIKLVELSNFIDSLPEKTNTKVGERGVNLSGGQKQRIGIARALYIDPSLLIFDEATSSLDIETEKKIFDSLKKIKKNRTLVLVTHKVDLLGFCDVIFEIRDGVCNKIKT